VSLEFDYPEVEAEAAIIAHEANIDAQSAEHLAVIGERVRNLKQHGFEEGVSTRLLIYAGELIRAGIAPRRAADVAIITAISDDSTVQQAVADIVDVILP
ncbi:MAG: CbbQ/NirQ/NorQ C-terminal domain-containing protein, partial [Pseudomonadota bacterium]